MSLTLAVSSSNITAAIINQVVNVLQQPSGGQEIKHYYCGGNSYTTSGRASCYVKSLSRNSVPVSVSLDQSDQGYIAASSLATDTLTQGGFHIWIQATGAAGNVSTGGVYTLQF